MRITLLPSLLLAAAAVGQAPASALARELVQDLLVPIHTQPADEAGGAYGIWAAGPNYKVSFHDGFAFYPHLGPEAPRHLPLQWHTESAAIGTVELLAAPSHQAYAGHRFERRTGDLIEAYDVRRDGVEQTFTLLARPAATGAFVITGRVTTPLSATVTDSRHGDLVFSDAGRPVVRYGSAFAIDAVGRRWPLGTGYDGARIRITVPAEVVAAAAYPLLVDPLSSAVALNTGSNALELPAIAASTAPSNPRVVVAWTRKPTATDVDVYALVTNLDYQSGTWLYQDVTASWSTPLVDVAYVAVGPKWVLALQRDLSATKVVRVYVHDYANTTMNSGTLLAVSQPAGVEQIRPAIGGSMVSAQSLLVFDRFDPGAQTTFTWGVHVNTAARSLGTAFRFDAGLLVQTRDPSVTPTRNGSTGWIVGVASGGEMRVAQVSSTAPVVVPTERIFNINLGRVSASRVAGGDGRFLLLLRHSVNFIGTSIHVKFIRFDWPAAASAPTTIRSGTLAYTGTTDVTLGGCAYDEVTRSHWALAYEVDNVFTLARCGYSGGITEEHALPGPTDITYARPNSQGTFPLAYAMISISGISIRARELRYPTDAISAAYGTSCAPGTTISTNRSFAGNEFYRVSLNGIPPGAPAIYALGSAPDHLDLGVIGLAGCYLNVMLPVVTMGTNASSGGTATVTYPLPDDPVFLGDIYSQWFFIDAAATQPLRATGGTRHQVR